MHTQARTFGRALRTAERFHGFEPLTVDGVIPPGLKGTFWRNGPGQFELFERPYSHWFDADGLATAVRFDDGHAQMACKIVECPELARERAAGKALFSSGQTRAPWWRMVGGRGKSVRNINMLAHDNQMYALAEGGLPIPIDAQTLQSGAPTGFVDGQATFHGHYRVDPRTGAVYGFGVEYGRQTTINVYRLLPGQGAERIARLPLSQARVLVHDIAFAGDAVILIIHPINIQILPLMLGFKTPFASMQWQDGEGSEVIIVPLDDPAKVQRFEVSPFYNFHFGNAFRDGDAWQVDMARSDKLDFSGSFTLDAIRSGNAAPTPVHFGRLTIRDESATWTQLSQIESEFPIVDGRQAGRRHRYTWAVRGELALGGLGRLDHETGDWIDVPLGTDVFPGEVSLVPYGADEDAVWVLSSVYDAVHDRAGMVVLDGATPGAEPVARVWYPHHVPPPLHGCFVPAS